jgi:hypothetical protein
VKPLSFSCMNSVMYQPCSGNKRHFHLSFRHLDMLVFLKKSGNTIKNIDTNSVNPSWWLMYVFFLLILLILQIFLAKSYQ